MKVQINSDKTVAVDDSLIAFVEGEVNRVLDRFVLKLTRVEVHLSDVDNRKTGQADKRCMVEARPAGARPLSATAKSTRLASAVGDALGKMQRSLDTFFGRKGRRAVTVLASVPPAKKTAVKKAATKKAATKKAAVKKAAVKKAAIKKAAVKTAEAPASRGPKKKRIYQARRKPWPSR
ncbi:MAG: HPF/RaiA family ribosome-associated protein [Bryobacteraceae bacterium]